MAQVRLERMVHGGVALGRMPEGRVILVAGGIPGELVETEPQEVSGVLRGNVESVVEASEDRVQPPAHPGLDYGFIAYRRQLELKREVVADALGRALRRDVEVPAVRPSPTTWSYRAAVQPAVVGDRLGYRRPGTAEVVTLESDPVANAAIGHAWGIWRGLRPPDGVVELVLRGNDHGETLAALVAAAPERDLVPFAHRLVDAGYTGVHYAAFDPRGRFRGGVSRLAGARSIHQRYGHIELSVTPTAFAQPNPGAAGELYATLGAWAPEGDVAVDLYAGGGAIALHLARGWRRVWAVEIDRGSVARGRRDAERAGVDNVEFARGDARRATIPPDAGLVVVDPPRAGLSKPLRETIVDCAADRLIYVSCDVATWSRDVAHFERSGWALRRFEPFDFYPHTHHIEILSLLERDAGTLRRAGPR